MLRNRAIAFGIVATFLAGSAGAEVQSGTTRYFKNWAVGCDNGLTCEAATLAPLENPAKSAISLFLKREIGGDEALNIRISGFASTSDRYRLFVDEQLVDTGAIRREDRSIAILGLDALKVARALVGGKDAKLVDGEGQILGGISLNGSAAALRYLDAHQRYAGSAAAIAAIGKRAVRAKALALPVISAKRINDKGAIPEASDLVALAEGSKCARSPFGVTVDSVHSLGNSSGKPQALALINCGGSAYNQSSAVYLGTQNKAGKWQFEPAPFDHADQAYDRKANLVLLSNSTWDAKDQRLTSVTKEREIGDCGFGADYIWDGSSFRLAQAREMKMCQGSMDWITIWRAKAQFVP